MQQRDSFLTEIYHAAERDSNIVLLSADFGAPTLDKFRENLPGQFLHVGISEQNAVNVAVGLALSGKKPYLYAMAPFWLRAYEQIKLAAVMGVPIQIVCVGAGLSYAGSGPTHYSLEDLQAYMALPVEVYTASTSNLAASIARKTLETDRLTITRLERGETRELYDPHEDASLGFRVFGKGIPYVTCGYLVHWLKGKGHSVVDVYHNKPLSPLLAFHLSEYDHVYTFEEQYGGFGASIAQLLNKHWKKTRVFTRQLPERGIYENGTREQLLEALL